MARIVWRSFLPPLIIEIDWEGFGAPRLVNGKLDFFVLIFFLLLKCQFLFLHLSQASEYVLIEVHHVNP